MPVQIKPKKPQVVHADDDSIEYLACPNGWRISYRLITAEKAREWLALNTHNRNMRQGVIGTWAEQMRVEGWIGDISPIAFNGYLDDDRSRPILLNGQHRLQSLASGDAKAIWWIVVEGVAIESQIEMDTGTRRKLDDQLRLRQIGSASDVAAILRVCYLWERDGPSGVRARTVGPGYSALLKWLDKNPNIVEVIPPARRLYNVIGGRLSVYGACRWILLQLDDPQIEESVDTFFDLIRTGENMPAGAAPLVFRNTILQLKAPVNKRRLSQIQMMAYLFKAWNHWQDGTKIQYISWRSGGRNPEPFPEPYVNL